MEQEKLAQLRYLRLIATLASLNIIFLLTGGLFVLSTTAARMDELFAGEVSRFREVLPAQYPFYMLLLWLGELPFIFGVLFGGLRDWFYIPKEKHMLRQSQFILLSCMLFFALAGLLAESYAQLYAILPNDIRTFSILRIEAYYFYATFAGIHHLVLGWNLWQWGNVPKWLAGVTFGAGLSAMLINFWQPNYEILSLRVIFPIMIISFEVMIWTLYLWVVTWERPPYPDDAPTIRLRD